MRVVNTKEMKEIEKISSEEFGLDESIIIENVGIRGAHKLHHLFLKSNDYGELILLIGKGNNGADGLSIGRHLTEYGYRVRAFMLFDQTECSSELRRQAKLAHGLGVKISEVKSSDEVKSYFNDTQDHYFVIDAIFGTGVRVPLSNSISDIIRTVNERADIAVAVDMPTGVLGDNGGTDGIALKADYTIAVGVPKIGYYSNNGAKHVGEVIDVKAGFPRKLISNGNKNLISMDFMARILGKRNNFAHKNSFGHTLVIGGCKGQTGAAILASNGALKTGSGLITVATWEDSYDELCMKLNPELMSRYIPDDFEALKELVKQTELFDNIVIGPGLGKRPRVRQLVLEVLLRFRGPIVLDADAINALNLKDDAKLLKGRTTPTILTPHLGEFAMLTNKSIAEVEANPVDNLRELVDQINCYVLLKGPGSYLGMPTGEIYINYMPNAGMATGGSGDVLAGILGGLMAQAQTHNQKFNISFMNNDWDATTCFGLYIHSLAGKFAAEQNGPRAMTAWSIINNLHNAFKAVQEHKQSLKNAK